MKLKKGKYKRTSKIREKMKKTHRKKEFGFKKGHKLNLGKKHNEITREKMGKTRKKLFKEGKLKPRDQRGELNNAWRGGISFEPYGLEFNEELREQIRTRDNHTCQECNYTQKQLKYKLSVHHIDFNKKNNVAENLITLCRSCHAQTYFNREKWIEYFQNKTELYS